VHPLKASSLISFTVLGMLTDFSKAFPYNAPLDIIVTPVGTVKSSETVGETQYSTFPFLLKSAVPVDAKFRTHSSTVREARREQPAKAFLRIIVFGFLGITRLVSEEQFSNVLADIVSSVSGSAML
jgi:hypothetical protein